MNVHALVGLGIIMAAAACTSSAPKPLSPAQRTARQEQLRREAVEGMADLRAGRAPGPAAMEPRSPLDDAGRPLPVATLEAPTLSPRLGEPPPQDAAGFDACALATRYPRGAWLPLVKGGAVPVVEVLINERPVQALLDTGAMISIFADGVARPLGLPRVRSSEHPRQADAVRIRDAEGAVTVSELALVRELDLGRFRFSDVVVAVADARDENLAIIGYDVLSQVDLLYAADAGCIGLFDAGTGPSLEGARRITLRRSERELVADVAVQGTDGPIPFALTVDTGASLTALPTPAAINAGVLADLTFNTTLVSVAGESEHRGRFVTSSLWLGPEGVNVGPALLYDHVHPLNVSDPRGLLGGDVFATHRTLISAARRILELSPAHIGVALRDVPAPGATTSSSVRMSLAPCPAAVLAKAPDPSGLCLRLDASGPLPALALDVRLYAGGRPVFAGSVATLLVSADKAITAFFISLHQGLQMRGLHLDNTVDLRVRRRAITEACPPNSVCTP